MLAASLGSPECLFRCGGLSLIGGDAEARLRLGGGGGGGGLWKCLQGRVHLWGAGWKPGPSTVCPAHVCSRSVPLSLSHTHYLAVANIFSNLKMK